MKIYKLILVAASLFGVVAAHAHDMQKGPNGGRVADVGSYHVELVVGGHSVSVFVSDGDNKPLSSAGFKALAILNAGGKVQRVVLAPADGKLGGSAETALPANVKGVVQLTAPDGKTAQGQFR